MSVHFRLPRMLGSNVVKVRMRQVRMSFVMALNMFESFVVCEYERKIED